MAQAPEASIVLPLNAGPAQALRCLQGIAAQGQQPSYEVIILHDPQQGLGPLLEGLQGDVRVIDCDAEPGIDDALRIALDCARGNLFVLLREAASPESGWLAPLAGSLQDRSVGLAISLSTGIEQAAQSALTAFALAARASDLRGCDIPDLPAQLLFAALALQLAERGLRVLPVAASAVAAPIAERAGSGFALAGKPELTVVIPTLDATSERLHRCLQSLRRHTQAAHAIVIVDNASPPQGFTAPVNAGVRAARSPYVAVMNDDVEVLGDWWEPLRNELEQGALIACPQTVVGGRRSDFTPWCFAFSSSELSSIEHAPGELFDPELVLWYQDIDLVRRLRRSAAAPVPVEASRILHGRSQTLHSTDPALAGWIRAQIAADRARYLRKYPDAQLEDVRLISEP